MALIALLLEALKELTDLLKYITLLFQQCTQQILRANRETDGIESSAGTQKQTNFKTSPAYISKCENVKDITKRLYDCAGMISSCLLGYFIACCISHYEYISLQHLMNYYYSCQADIYHPEIQMLRGKQTRQ